MPTTPTSRDELHARIAHELGEFQKTAQLASLRHAQMRDYIAEHLADALLPLLGEIDRLNAEPADSCPAECPCRQIPLPARWDNTVIQPDPDATDEDTIVCCIADGGQPVALALDDEHREALGLLLLLPDGDGEVDPEHLELARENERLRAELAAALACLCPDGPGVHQVGCPALAGPAGTEG